MREHHRQREKNRYEVCKRSSHAELVNRLTQCFLSKRNNIACCVHYVLAQRSRSSFVGAPLVALFVVMAKTLPELPFVTLVDLLGNTVHFTEREPVSVPSGKPRTRKKCQRRSAYKKSILCEHVIPASLFEKEKILSL